MEKREDRRDRSWRYAARAQREHLRVVHPTGVVDCICEQSVLYFRKRKSLGCRCRGRKRGQPKVGAGCCYGYGALRPAVAARIEGARLVRQWRQALTGHLPDDIEL